MVVSLPGELMELMESNASRQVGNRLVWVFWASDFSYEDHYGVIIRLECRFLL